MNMNDLNVIHAAGRTRQIIDGSKTKRAKKIYSSACTCGRTFRASSREDAEGRRNAHIQEEAAS